MGTKKNSPTSSRSRSHHPPKRFVETRLKDATASGDARLARLLQFDTRSRNFPMSELLGSRHRKPRSYTWNFWPDKSQVPHDQGNVGSCVGNSWAQECMIRPLATHMSERFAREKIYWEAQRIDPWPGGEYPGASPRYAGTSVLAGAKVMLALGLFREYRWAFGLDDLIQTLGYHGPAVMGTSWYHDMYFPDKQGYVKPTGAYFGGHAYVAAGVSTTDRSVLFINSWGGAWGGGTGIRPGWFRMKYEDVDRLLHDAGEVCVPSLRRSPDFEDRIKEGGVRKRSAATVHTASHSPTTSSSRHCTDCRIPLTHPAESR